MVKGNGLDPREMGNQNETLCGESRSEDGFAELKYCKYNGVYIAI